MRYLVYLVFSEAIDEKKRVVTIGNVKRVDKYRDGETEL